MTKGRKRITIDIVQFWQLYSQWISGEISQKDIYHRLNISRATLARRLDEFRKHKQDETNIQSQIFSNPTNYKLNEINIGD